MPADKVDNSEMIARAAEALLTRRPSYKSLLLFYRDIFLSQEAARLQTELVPIDLSDDLIALKQQENFPLIAMADFSFDQAGSSRLLKTVCETIQRHNTELSAFAETILQADADRLDTRALFEALLAGDNDGIERVALTLGIDGKALAFVAYTSLRPSLVECARQLASLLEDRSVWHNGYCPICGNYPGLVTLDEQGHQILHCQFCWHPWSVKRVFCPFCSSTDGQSQRYFYSDTEENLRVNVCDKCGKYIKGVDIRKSDYPVYPPLEQITTLHLDIKAQEEGYQSGIELALKI